MAAWPFSNLMSIGLCFVGTRKETILSTITMKQGKQFLAVIYKPRVNRWLEADPSCAWRARKEAASFVSWERGPDSEANTMTAAAAAATAPAADATTATGAAADATTAMVAAAATAPAADATTAMVAAVCSGASDGRNDGDASDGRNDGDGGGCLRRRCGQLVAAETL
ncbi:REST corepressor 1-like [Triticum dicoccoides]|uniref:REST corepressor 1-like n=1 Tax=Triticum dicoccoides TaxID=85692 RepID=UPI0018904AFC|nr:REST corepressor 1-like [Triticum dicoccoides]